MFQKSREPAPRTVAKPMAGSTFSVFGADIRIKGDVAASADLHIDGRVEGDVTCTSLVQGEASEIIGAIKAESARLSGTVRGTITVRELVVLKSARIHGDVHYDALTIEQGAQVDGRFAPRVAGEDATVVALAATSGAAS
jgi:cytoskeletal protein CcmA (bactofilin family)